jgi:hypothetical protein
MFRKLRDLVDLTVDKAGFVAKVGVEVATCLSAAVVAEPLKKAIGENAVSGKMWQLQRKVSDRMCNLIEDVTPVTKAVAKVSIRKAEKICELGQGVGQVLFTEQKKEGYEKIENSLTDMAALLITGGLVGAALEYYTDAAEIAQEIEVPETGSGKTTTGQLPGAAS